MVDPLNNNLAEIHPRRFGRPRASDCVDLHCHCLPRLDDGPATLTGALNLCRALVDDGITMVVASPHQLGRYEGCNSPAIVRKAVAELNETLGAEAIPLTVFPGADVRLDERIPKFCDTDGVLTVGDCRQYLMLELPHEAFIDVTPLLNDLRPRGLRIILSHPERNGSLTPQAVAQWVDSGAVLQVTAASLIGDFGPAAECAAWYWLTFSAVALVATDAHDTSGRRPRMSDAFALIAARLGHNAARRACIDNPLRVLAGQELSTMAGWTRAKEDACK